MDAKVINLKIIEKETKKIISLIQWFRLEATVNHFEWRAKWERKRNTEEGNMTLLRSTDLTESWIILDTYEGEIEEFDPDTNIIYVKNCRRIGTRAKDTATLRDTSVLEHEVNYFGEPDGNLYCKTEQ